MTQPLCLHYFIKRILLITVYRKMTLPSFQHWQIVNVTIRIVYPYVMYFRYISLYYKTLKK